MNTDGSPTAPPTCDHCGSPLLRKHCESQTCDWQVCRRCQSYGFPGSLMVDMRPKEMR